MSSKALEVKNLKKYFKTGSGMLHAVDDVSFHIDHGETVGLVGESGCGKSTIGRVIVALSEATAGQVLLDGVDICSASKDQIRELRKRIQIVFQDPYASLDGRKNVFESIAEPLYVQKVHSTRNEYRDRVFALMDRVGLARRLASSYPHELDGGRRQRVGVARALALNPSFIVLDEPVSALDVSVQAQIINLLEELQEELKLTYLFISHDLSVVRHISDRIIVMYVGKIVETSDYASIFEDPRHPYTQALLSAIPLPSLESKRERIILEGDVPNPISPKPGCRFAPRCKHRQELCTTTTPHLQELLPGHFVACFYADGTLST